MDLMIVRKLKETYAHARHCAFSIVCVILICIIIILYKNFRDT